MSTVSSGEIHYIADFGAQNDGYKLLEVDETLLQYILDGGSFHLKATEKEDVVACSYDTTYAVTLVESSNTLYVMDSPAEGSSASEPAYYIKGSASGVLELMRTAPRVPFLLELLHQRELTETHFATNPLDETIAGDSAEHTQSEQIGYSWSFLSDRIQCSDFELREALQAANAFEFLEDSWCILSEDVVERVIDAILLQCMANGWKLGHIPRSQCVSELSDSFPVSVIAHVLKIFSSTRSTADENTVCISFLKLAKHLGIRTMQRLSMESRLKHASGGVGVPTDDKGTRAKLNAVIGSELAELVSDASAVAADKLLLAWEEAMPVGAVTAVTSPVGPSVSKPNPTLNDVSEGPLSLDLLRGDILLDVNVAGHVVVRLLPSSALSHSPVTRFSQLFAIRQRWTLSDLEAYIEPLVGFGVTRDDLLLAHTRSTVQADGSRLFSAR